MASYVSIEKHAVIGNGTPAPRKFQWMVLVNARDKLLVLTCDW